MADRKKPYKVKLEVTYSVYIPVNAFDENEAIDEIEAVVKNSDDYEIVNRSSEKRYEITEIKENYPAKDNLKKKKKK